MNGKFGNKVHSQNFKTGTFATSSSGSAAGYTENLSTSVWVTENKPITSCLVYCMGSAAGDMCTILAKVNF